MKIHPFYVHALGDVQVRTMHRLPIVGLREPIDGGAIGAWTAILIIVAALATGVWIR